MIKVSILFAINIVLNFVYKLPMAQVVDQCRILLLKLMITDFLI